MAAPPGRAAMSRHDERGVGGRGIAGVVGGGIAGDIRGCRGRVGRDDGPVHCARGTDAAITDEHQGLEAELVESSAIGAVITTAALGRDPPDPK